MRASTAMKKLSMATATVALTALGTAGSAAAISFHSITDLGYLGGPLPYSVANDINNKGQVVGKSFGPTFIGNQRPFLWENGKMTELPMYSFQAAGEALSINDAGDMVGWTSGSIAFNRYMFVDWKSASGLLPGGGTGRDLPDVSDLNNAGQMVFRDDQGFSFLWNKGRITPLWGSFSAVSDINDAGHVIGSLSDGGFLCDKGITYLNKPGYTPELRFTPPGVWCDNQPITYLDFTPYKINNAGQIIGSSVFWDKGTTTNLGSLGGATQARDINDKGAVVGSSFTSSGAERAFLWENGIMVDLNDLLPQNSGWELTQARAINDLGQIVGAGRLNGQTHLRAFLVNTTPVPGPVQSPPPNPGPVQTPPPNPGSGSSPATGSQRVPEPTSLLSLLAFGAIGIAMHKRQ